MYIKVDLCGGNVSALKKRLGRVCVVLPLAAMLLRPLKVCASLEAIASGVANGPFGPASPLDEQMSCRRGTVWFYTSAATCFLIRLVGKVGHQSTAVLQQDAMHFVPFADGTMDRVLTDVRVLKASCKAVQHAPALWGPPLPLCGTLADVHFGGDVMLCVCEGWP